MAEREKLKFSPDDAHEVVWGDNPLYAVVEKNEEPSGGDGDSVEVGITIRNMKTLKYYWATYEESPHWQTYEEDGLEFEEVFPETKTITIYK